MTTVKGLYPSFVYIPLKIPTSCLSKERVLEALKDGGWRWCGETDEGCGDSEAVEGGIDGTTIKTEDGRTQPDDNGEDEDDSDEDDDTSLHISLHWTPMFVAFTSVRPFLSALRVGLSSLGADAVVATITDDLEVFQGGGGREYLVARVEGLDGLKDMVGDVVEKFGNRGGAEGGEARGEYKMHVSLAWRGTREGGRKRKRGEEEDGGGLDEDDEGVDIEQQLENIGVEPTALAVSSVIFQAGEREYTINT